MSIEEFIIFIYVIIEQLYPIVVIQPLRTRGFPPAVTDVEISQEIRERDKERFETEVAADDVYAGIGLQYTGPRPTAPLITPKHTGQILNEDDTHQ